MENSQSRCCIKYSNSSIDVRAKLSKFDIPLFPRHFRRVKTVSHVAQELNLHNVNLMHRYSRNFCPCFVRVGIVIKKLVSEHQGYCKQAIFTARFAFYGRIEALEPVDEEHGKKDDVWSDLGGREQRSYPLSEPNRRPDIRGCRG